MAAQQSSDESIIGDYMVESRRAPVPADVAL